MIIKEISSKTILSKSKIHDYVINPYIGCAHGCTYCYARFIKKFTGHKEAWGTFVDVKINAPELLTREIRKKKRGTVWISGLCDPYQPSEKKYAITRECLRILAENDWPVVIQTRSPLVLRDIDILRKFQDIEAGFSVTTADDSIRKLFEPAAPSIEQRLDALQELKDEGIRTYAMIAPLLPGAESLGEALKHKIDHLIIDRINYHWADAVYRKYHLEDRLFPAFFHEASKAITNSCKNYGIISHIV